jgi:hypothetical protein
MKLFFKLLLVVVVAFSMLHSCTIEKRVFRKGYSVTWRHKLKSQSGDETAEPEECRNSKEIAQNTIPETSSAETGSGIEPLDTLENPMIEDPGNLDLENVEGAIQNTAEKEITDALPTKKDKSKAPDYYSANVLAGICVGILIGIIVYALIASGIFQKGSISVQAKVFLLCLLALLVIILIIFGIVRSIIRY